MNCVESYYREASCVSVERTFNPRCAQNWVALSAEALTRRVGKWIYRQTRVRIEPLISVVAIYEHVQHHDTTGGSPGI